MSEMAERITLIPNSLLVEVWLETGVGGESGIGAWVHMGPWHGVGAAGIGIGKSGIGDCSVDLCPTLT
jgi:hypothetical protein